MLQNVVSPIKKTPARAALEQCPIGVAILDTANQERLFANQALADIFEAGSVAGMLAGELRDTWVDQAEYARLIKQLNDGQHFANLETERLTLTGRPIWLLMNTQDLEFLGKAAKLVWHVDITDRKEAEAAVVASREELNYQIAELRDREERLEEQAKTLVNLAEDQAELRMELQRLNQNKDKFFSIIAHDLRSPFNALMGYTELLTAGARTMKREVMADYSASVHEAAQQAFKLMENLLQWSRLQMDQVSMEITNLDLSQTARTNIDLLTPVAAKKGVELVDGTIQVVMAAADRDMMDTILRNLISNAIKFTPTGGKIIVSTEQTDSECHINVVDTGLGVPRSQLADLLRIDQKTTSTGTAGETGTGLGLPLCAELTEKLGGRLTLDSAPGRGMTARLTLPAGASD